MKNLNSKRGISTSSESEKFSAGKCGNGVCKPSEELRQVHELEQWGTIQVYVIIVPWGSLFPVRFRSTIEQPFTSIGPFPHVRNLCCKTVLEIDSGLVKKTRTLLNYCRC